MKRLTKWLIYLLIGILLIGIVYALDECGDSVPIDEPCSIVTPYLSYCAAYTLDIYHSNGTKHTDAQTMTQISTSSIYNYTVNLTIPDTYVVKACDDSVRTIIALNTSAITPSASWWSYLLQIYYNTLPGAW